GLHGVEELDHANQARRHEHFIEHVGLIGRNDRNAEHLAEAGGKNEQPNQRPDEGGQEALALMQKAQHLAPGDAGKAGGIAGKPKPVFGDLDAHGTAPARSFSTMRKKAVRKFGAWVSASKAGPRPLKRTRPLCNRTMASCSPTSSTRWVAHKTPTPRSFTKARTMASTLSREATSRPAVASSSNRQLWSCSRARATSTRRACPPDSARTFSPARSPSPALAKARAARRLASPRGMPCREAW